MKLATNDWPGFRPLYLAEKLGYMQALDSIRTKNEESLSVLAVMDNLSVVEYPEAFKGLCSPDFAKNQKLLNNGEKYLGQSIVQLKKVMSENHLLNKDIDMSNMYNNQSLLKAKL